MAQWVKFTSDVDYRHKSRAVTAYKTGMILYLPDHIVNSKQIEGKVQPTESQTSALRTVERVTLATMADHILECRKAMVTAMRASSALNLIAPYQRIYGEEVPANPTWPFVLCGLPTEAPLYASCWDASTLSVVVHGFSRGPGMDGASALGNAIKRALSKKTIVRSGLTITIQHLQTQIIRDTPESSDFHAIVRFEADCVEAVV